MHRPPPAHRVAITGIGIVGPTGLGPQPFWQALLDQQPAIRRLSRFDATSYPCQVGGEVPDLSYENLFEPRKRRSTTHVAQLALAATELALQDAGLPSCPEPAQLTAVVLGTALGGSRDGEQQHIILLERGARRINPFIANVSGAYGISLEIAGKLSAQGPVITFSTGCSASSQAIGHAASLIASGHVDLSVTGGAESPLSPLVFAGMSRTLELAASNGNPDTASRPFDRDHCGIVLSEGACILILEPFHRARSRRARIYAEILAESSSCDGAGIYSVDPSGSAAARALHHALRCADLSPDRLDYVCSHANSSPTFDRKEAAVLTAAFGEYATSVPISSIKGVMGHPFGASGAFQTAAASLAIHNRIIPPTTNLNEPDPLCRLGHVRGQPMPRDVHTALVSSYGYGGLNTFLILGHPDR